MPRLIFIYHLGGWGWGLCGGTIWLMCCRIRRHKTPAQHQTDASKSTNRNILQTKKKRKKHDSSGNLNFLASKTLWRHLEWRGGWRGGSFSQKPPTNIRWVQMTACKKAVNSSGAVGRQSPRPNSRWGVFDGSFGREERKNCSVKGVCRDVFKKNLLGLTRHHWIAERFFFTCEKG